MTDTMTASEAMPPRCDLAEPFLVVEDLTVRFPTEDGLVKAVTDLSYTVELGKTLGIVGESGSGKSVSRMAVLGLHDAKRAGSPARSGSAAPRSSACPRPGCASCAATRWR